MKRFLLLSLLFLLSITFTKALTTEQRLAMKHSFSIGYGEQFWDLFYTGCKAPSVGETVSRKDYYNKRITGNIFAEYMYQATKVLSVGMNVNYNGWTSMVDEYSIPDVEGQKPNTYKRAIHTIGLIPTLNFTYYNKDNVNLYSGIGVGATIITENNSVYALPAFDFCLLGVSFGKEHWFGNVEIGGLVSTLILVNTLPTRFLSVGFGYRF